MFILPTRPKVGGYRKTLVKILLFAQEDREVPRFRHLAFDLKMVSLFLEPCNQAWLFLRKKQPSTTSTEEGAQTMFGGRQFAPIDLHGF